MFALRASALLVLGSAFLLLNVPWEALCPAQPGSDCRSSGRHWCWQHYWHLSAVPACACGTLLQPGAPQCPELSWCSAAASFQSYHWWENSLEKSMLVNYNFIYCIYKITASSGILFHWLKINLSDSSTPLAFAKKKLNLFPSLQLHLVVLFRLSSGFLLKRLVLSKRSIHSAGHQAELNIIIPIFTV